MSPSSSAQKLVQQLLEVLRLRDLDLHVPGSAPTTGSGGGATSNSAPDGAGLRWELVERGFHLRDHHRTLGPNQELLDIPGVLRPRRIELEEDEIGATRHGHPRALNRGVAGTGENPRLPRALVDDEVEWVLPGQGEPCDAGQWIVGAASPQADRDTLVPHGSPEVSRQALRGDHKKVEVAGRARDTVHRHGRGSDDSEWNVPLSEQGRDVAQETQPKAPFGWSLALR